MADGGVPMGLQGDPRASIQPLKFVSRAMRAYYLGLNPESQGLIRADPSILNVALVAKTYKKKTRK